MLVLSINVASAADNTTKEVISLSEKNTLGDPATIGTFDELQKYIDKSTTGQISLNRSYDYDSTDSAYITGINITKAIEIEGNGYTIDGNHTARIFNVTAGDVVLKNINFVNANATLNSGGAIYNSANNLKIINCTFNSNHAKDGGAIYSEGKNATIDLAYFNANNATQGSAIVTLGIINVNENITGLELATGVYTVNLITIVDANHTTAINRMSTITVKKADSSVSVDSVKAVYGEEIVIPISCENATDIDYIIINGDGIVVAEGTVEPGKDINVYELPVGDYIVKVTTVTDNNHSSVSAEANLTINKAIPIITIQVVDIMYGEVEVLNITSTAPGTVNVTVNGMTNTLELNSVSNGLLSYSILYLLKEDQKATWNIYNLPVGEYPAFAIYNANENYESVNTSDVFNVNPIKPSINIKVNDINVGDTLEIEVSLPDDATGIITVEIDGKNYTAPVKYGKAIIHIPGLTAGNKVAKIYYSGDDHYSPIEDSVKFKVNKILPTLNIDSKDIAVGKDGKIVITLPTDATGTVTIEVDGKTYTAQVENGKAILIIPGLSEGVHNIKVSYSGDDKYLPINATDTIKVLSVDDKNETPQKDKIENVKTGLSANETGNPIVVLMLVLIAFAFSPLRRFKK